jgi:HK97 gp10 family phage protein
MARRGRGRLTNGQFFAQVLESWGKEAEQAGKEALRRGAERVVADAKNLCPVRTGALRDSIHAEERADGARQVVTASAADPATGYDYSRIVEYHPTKGRPFLHPALDANAEQVREDVLEAIRRTVRQQGR